MTNKRMDSGCKKAAMKSFRCSPALLELIVAECQARNITVSSYLRESATANLRRMKSRAIDAWGRSEL
jgi:hypothetical protein